MYKNISNNNMAIANMYSNIEMNINKANPPIIMFLIIVCTPLILYIVL